MSHQDDQVSQEDMGHQEGLHLSEQAIRQAESVIGLAFTDEERGLMLKGVNDRLKSYEKLRTIQIDNSVPPALLFVPELPVGSGEAAPASEPPRSIVEKEALSAPDDLEDLAFYPVGELARLLRSRVISSTALTMMYLDRLKRYGPQLECVITLTEDLALAQARKADEELAAGLYRSVLHGIPWGAKDLLATRGIPTTWGAMPYKDQVLDTDATVVERLTDAGAVLVAKLTMGALAWGDVWFGGKTRSPWNLEEGASGSSAGSASAVAAGLVGFAIGTETHGSIVSPCTRCGATGLRPTFGRVSRYGAMALSWSMDKIGPICRSVEDCAIVFDLIHGADGKDGTAVTRPFSWNPAQTDLGALRLGYVESAFSKERENKDHDDAAFEVLRSLGAKLVPVELPDFPLEAIDFILSAEAAAAFDELTRSDKDELLVRQIKDAWPNRLREARLIPAVEYIQANRARTLAMREMAQLMQEIDLYVSPSLEGNTLLMTNLTGHPAVVVPNGFTSDGIPSNSLTFTGRLFDETTPLLVAKAYQDRGDFHRRHPSMTW
jgi:Asp-tRNA(Asn)/Glu-tRNA(Gln) amidotransferase A subunit family amidase